MVTIPQPIDTNSESELIEWMESLGWIEHANYWSYGKDELGSEPTMSKSAAKLLHQQLEAKKQLQPIPMVNGLDCPACGHPTLILGNGGYVTCSLEGCPNPDYSEAVEAKLAEARSNESARILDWHYRLKHTLIINRNDSKCGNCGRDCDFNEKRHDTLLGYDDDNGKPGCRYLWKYVASDYTGMDERLKKMRPDLELMSTRPFSAHLTDKSVGNPNPTHVEDAKAAGLEIRINEQEKK